MSQQEFLRAPQVAEILGIGVSTVWRHAKQGKLPRSTKIGGSRRWAKADLQRAYPNLSFHVASQEPAPTAKIVVTNPVAAAVLDRMDANSVVEFNPDRLPRSGVYFLILNGHVVYVGQSRNIVQRINTHRADKAFDKVQVFPCEPYELNDYEGFFIRLLRPPLNGDPSKTPASKLWDRFYHMENL
ncbi:helix-turn-helix domain-containing protein [Ruegeria sp. EL01]|jgi:predicted DNA-binding transcriptional regulator AlpA|uniref:helix-turn-helix domain-containing protein n=1 Tax=Ruegeria sp. EL01 TaxID=2107578 RepID=UPI000EA8130C|nr:helix-turn-helix domain-containing protein [Ruegeria sp. EL01]